MFIIHNPKHQICYPKANIRPFSCKVIQSKIKIKIILHNLNQKIHWLRCSKSTSYLFGGTTTLPMKSEMSKRVKRCLDFGSSSVDSKT